MTIRWISIRVTNCTIHWIEIYPVDGVIQLLNSWGLLYIWSPARNLTNDWNLESTFHGQGILNPVPAIRDLQHKIRNPQRAIQKPRFSLMHLILEECQPVSRRVSFHKRCSSVRKSDKGAIMGSHLIQAADNVPRKLNFYFLNFPYCIPKFHMSCRSSNNSQ